MAMEQKFYDMMEANPVIVAVKDTDGLEKCCRMEEIKVIFILYGDICSIDGIVRRVRECGKLAFVHVDLITGLIQILLNKYQVERYIVRWQV